MDEAASAGQEGPLAGDPAQRSVSNMFRGFFRVSTGSKLALKLYGSRKAVAEEQNRQREGKHWVIHPLSTFRQELGERRMQGRVRDLLPHHYADVVCMPVFAGGTGTGNVAAAMCHSDSAAGEHRLLRRAEPRLAHCQHHHRHPLHPGYCGQL